jgi:hypothetical protein
MEISKKRIAVKLNSQVGIISAKCQDEISRLSSDLILTQTAQKDENSFNFRHSQSQKTGKGSAKF